MTVGQFRAFVRDKHYSWQDRGSTQSENQPAVYVSWNDAVAFCDWLSKKEGKQYRLPTEAEWEYSCRAGTTTAYSFGDDPSKLGEYAWFTGNSGGKTHEVGTKKPNAWGLYDMHGNVWQWCQDWYDDRYKEYSKDSPTRDPQGPSAGRFRVYRGGSFSSTPSYCRSASRYRNVPTLRDSNLGFRVVLVR